MTELIIYGRGGQGGVTLAKLIATAYFLRGKHVQAFGLYAAERSGAPIQAFVRIDETEITNHNQIREPDHVIVLDRTLIGPGVLAGLKTEGWLILNTPATPAELAETFSGRRLATVDGTAIALDNGLGTRTVPIVNTTMLGAVARVLELELADVEAALAQVKFGGGNVTAARQAFDGVQVQILSGSPAKAPESAVHTPVAGLFDDEVGSMPRIQTGSWATRQPQRHELTPPCNHGCPAGNDVQGFVSAVADEDCDKALRILLETSPLPGTCGRVCPAPCMEACNRSQFDESVNIRELERYAADHGRPPVAEKPSREQRIAVIGSGPAGLSVTYHLARLGYPVSLYEAGREIGGLLRTGIPAYRLPRDVLDAEINHILSYGVETFTGVRIKRDGLLALTHQFAAVFVATGLQETRALNIGNLPEGVVCEGIDFLDRARRREEWLGGQRVVVLGGGNTAIDASRTALRLGASSVRILYRRTRAEMPAITEEIEEALEEGVALHELISPLRLHTDTQEAILTCTRMKLGEPDESGRPRPIPEVSEDAHFDVPCERVIMALGQTPDLSIWPEGTEVHEGEEMLGLMGAPVFAGGDLATNEGTVTDAIGSGRRAALHIHRTLSGEDLFPEPAEPIAAPEAITMHVFSHAPQETAPTVLPTWRRRSFNEVRLGMVDEPGHHQASSEAQRCFSCGVCNNCDRCTAYCPEGILVREDSGYRFEYDHCKGCGICASQCPRGVIYMSEL